MPAVINTPVQEITAKQIKVLCDNVRSFSYGQTHEALTKLKKSGRIDRERLQKVIGSNGRVRNLLQEKIMEIVLSVASESG